MVSPTKPELVDRIEETLSQLRKKVDGRFGEYLQENEKLPAKITEQTVPFHWALEFWYLFFDDDGNPLSEELKGAHVVIGNPPYERIQVLKGKSPIYVEYLDNSGYEAIDGNYDLAVVFVERGYKLLREGGEFGYIVTNKFFTADYGEGLRKFLSEHQAVREIVNFGDQQVFEDAATYTTLLFLRRGESPKLKYAVVRRLARSIEQLTEVSKADEVDNATLLVTVRLSGSLTASPWTLASDVEEEIVDTIGKNEPLSEFADRIFQGLVTGADRVYFLEIVSEKDGLVEVFSKERGEIYTLERELLRPALKGKHIEKWAVSRYRHLFLFPYLIEKGKARLVDPETFEQRYPRTWKYLLHNRETLGQREGGKWKDKDDWYAYSRRQNVEQFDQQKIMTQVLSHGSSFALDNDSLYYFVGGGTAGGYGVIPKKDSGLTLEYLCGLLNSSLLDWRLKQISTRFRGGHYSYGKQFIERLPIKIPESEKETELASEIEELVRQAIKLKGVRDHVISVWREVSERLKNSKRKLTTILAEDAGKARVRKFEDCWTRKVSFYPNKKEGALSKEFQRFEMRGDDNQHIVGLYGVDEDNNEDLVYEMEFRDRDLMQLVYFSILSLLDSRAQVKTLEDVFEKTVVPVVQPNILESSPSIIERVRRDLEREGVPEVVKEWDIAGLDNEVRKREAEVDAYVFMLYGLNEADINTVLGSLSRPSSYQEQVLASYR